MHLQKLQRIQQNDDNVYEGETRSGSYETARMKLHVIESDERRADLIVFESITQTQNCSALSHSALLVLCIKSGRKRNTF